MDLKWKELIVTQWDVNFIEFKHKIVCVLELIVRQWDVNANDDTSIAARSYGINSYIVGCKCCVVEFWMVQ